MKRKKEIIITHPYQYDATRKVNDNIKLVTDVKATLTKSDGATIMANSTNGHIDPTKTHSYAYNTDNTKNYKQKFTVTSEDGNNTQEYTVKILFTVPQTADKNTDAGKKENIKTLVNAVYTEIQNAGDTDAKRSQANLNHLDISAVKNLEYLFANFSSSPYLNKQRIYLAEIFNGNISEWNVSNVTNMEALFYNASKFNGDISQWNVSEVTSMGALFYNAVSFNQPLKDWNVSNVTNMVNMFNSCINFNQDISNWKVSNVTNMTTMFASAYSFNQDLSGWDVSKVTEKTNFDNGVFNWVKPKPRFP